MAQPQQPSKQAKDPYAQRSKLLTSTAQKVRGWVGSDPSRTGELADALVELTAHRLLGHAWAAAAPDAQEAVKLSAQLLTANGPIGPYTAIEDAARYVTAVVQLAAVQVGLGLPDAAGRSIASLADLEEQLGADTLAASLSARTAVWALSATARAALASGDVAAANAYADAAQDRLAESALIDDADVAYLVLDTDRLSADARWAAGEGEASLRYLAAAKVRYDEQVDGRLAEPARHSVALRERLAEPLPGIYGDLADRLGAVGDRDLALAVRRDLELILRKLGERSPESTRVLLATALAGLGADLRAAGREREADPVLAEVAALDPASGSRVPAVLGELVRWEAVTGSAAYRGTTPASGGRASREAELSATAQAWRESARAAAERSESALWETAQIEAERAAAAAAAKRQAEADRVEAERLAAERTEREQAERLEAAQEAERQERKRRRAERIEEHRRLEEQEEAERRTAEQAEYERRVAERRAADPAEIERLELERLQAEIDELEEREQRQVEAERRAAEDAEEAQLAAEKAAAERAAVERDEAEDVERRREEAERRAAADAEEARLAAEEVEEARRTEQRADAEAEERALAEAEDRAQEERVEAERLESERLESERLEAERVEVQEMEPEEDEFAVAQREWNEAKSRGDRRASRAANERVVELLRVRTREDLAGYGPALVSALEDLSRARLRSGDIFGSRAPSKEAKALAKTLNV